MLRYNFKTAIRNLLKSKTSSIINIIGLTIGLSVVIIISIFIKNELSYDSFNKNADRIYRIINKDADDKDSYAGSPPPLGEFLKSNIPEVINFTRLHKISEIVEYKNKKFYEDNFFLADPSLFEIFTFPLVKGDIASALNNPNSMVVTEQTAKKYFGNEDPIGKTVTLDGGFEFIISAVAKDVPENSHFHFDFLIPFERLNDILHTSDLKRWGGWNYYTYVLTSKNANIKELKSKLNSLFKSKLPDIAEYFADLTFQPIKDIHFKFNRKNLEPAFDAKYLTIFIAVAIAVLLIACINFINLTTARSIKRSKEVGLRKTIGANNIELVKQFLTESILLSIIAGVFSILIVELALPAVNSITSHHYSIDYSDINNYLILIGLILLTGIFAGAYPAIVLSSFQPVKALKGKIYKESSSIFRNVLVVFQFTVSIALIACTIIIIKQIHFIKNKNLGFADEQIVNIRLKSRDLMLESPVIKKELLQNKYIVSASVNSYEPSSFNEHWSGFKWENMSVNEKNNQLWIINADRDFIKTYQIKMIEGKDYAANFESKDIMAFILNKSAEKLMDFKNAVGKEIYIGGSHKAEIVGVMDDFNYRSLHNPVQPCAIRLRDKGPFISLRIKADNISASMNSIKKTWDSFGFNVPFDYYFLDEDLAKMYKTENQIEAILVNFSLVAIFIACIGLFGLSTFIAERRKKEIGIRKVLGASTIQLLREFSFDFTKWVILANLISWPIAYYVMNNWLQDFAYRIDLNWWMFVISGGIALIIALATVSYQAIKSALANPVKSLRYE